MANNRWNYGGTKTFSTTEAGYVTDLSIACNKIMIQPHEDNEGPICIGSITGVTDDWVTWNKGDVFIENVSNARDIIIKVKEAGDKVRWQVAI